MASCRGHESAGGAARPRPLHTRRVCFQGESQNLEGGLGSVLLGDGAEAPRQGLTPNPCLAVQLWGALGGARGTGLSAGTGWALRGRGHGARTLCWPRNGSTCQAQGARVAPAAGGQAAEL